LIGGDKQIRRRPASICRARVDEEANEETTSTPFSFLYSLAISCMALVSDAAAKTVTLPSSASAWPATESVNVAPAKKRNH
jgi:hypothetical protein